MANREIVVRLRAEAGDFRRTFAAAQKDAQGLDAALGRTSRNADASVGRMGGSFARLSTSIRDNRDAWDDLGSKALIGGAAIGAGMGLATKAAIDWESAWAGVKKTTEATPAQFAELEQGLRGLAKTLPATHEEIAGVAEAAGQLGIARKDIIGFTETAIALGESTNLSAEDAATGLAKISNVMGTIDREGVEGIERMGSALVALGNDGASTEADILAMAQRLSGAGDLIGATEADILAMSSALSSVGIESELGGGAMSRGLQLMNTAVIEGDEKLQLFAKTAGMTADEFATAWRANPIAAANEFVAGLGRVSASGGDAAEVLNDVGLRGTQNAQVFLRAAGASELLTDQLKLGAAAYADNSALMDEANQRYATTASRLQIAQNSMKDAAIDIGSVAGPFLAGFAEKLAGIANGFVGLPEPVKNATGAVGGLVAAGALLTGGTVKVVGWAQDFGDALEKIGAKGPKTERAISGVSTAAKGLGKALGLVAVAGTVGALMQEDAGAIGVEKMTRQMLDGADAAKVLNATLSENAIDTGLMEGNVDSLGKAFQVAFDPSFVNSFNSGSEQVISAVTLGMADMTSGAEEAEKAFALIDEQLSGLVASGQGEFAQGLFDQYMVEIEAAGGSTDQFLSKLPTYTEALASNANQADLTGDATSELGGEIDEVGQAADDAEEKIEDLADAIEGLGGGFRSERQAARDVRDAISDIGEAAKGSKDDQEAALDDLADKYLKHIAIMARNGEGQKTLEQATRNAREEYIKLAGTYGIVGKEAENLADQQGLVDEDVALMYESMGIDDATNKVKDLKAAQDTVKPNVTTSVSAPGATKAREDTKNFWDAVTLLPSQRSTAVGAPGAVDARSKAQQFYDSLVRLPGTKQTSVSAPGAPGAKVQVNELGDSIFRVPDTKNITVNANTSAAAMALAGIAAAVAAVPPVKTVTIQTRQSNIPRADGGIDEFRGGRHIQAMANGGTWDPSRPWDTTLGRMQPGIKPVTSRGILMAEEGAGPWEAFISGHPAKLERSRAIWLETGKKLGLIEAFANGGVYGNWQAELRNVRSMAAQYRRTIRFEDGSSRREDPLQIFEDGTARWAGFYAAPAGVASAIARLNAAQDRYEDAKRNPQKGKHSAEYYETKRRQQENARNRYQGKHSAEYYETKRRQQENARRRGQSSGGSGKVAGPRKLKMLGPEVGGGDGIGLPKLGSYRYPGRDASTRSVSSQNWIPGRTAGGGVDSVAIGRAVAGAIAGYQPVVQIGDREFYGVMQRVNTNRRGR